jgi:uncharacterized 2Fe-2S/4Fe-4S cluster protein (DUF4445 family)
MGNLVSTEKFFSMPPTACTTIRQQIADWRLASKATVSGECCVFLPQKKVMNRERKRQKKVSARENVLAVARDDDGARLIEH